MHCSDDQKIMTASGSTLPGSYDPSVKAVPSFRSSVVADVVIVAFCISNLGLQLTCCR